MVGPIIRSATHGDARELARLRWEFRPDAHVGQELGDFAARFEDWFVGALDSGSWTAAVADEGDGTLVGCVFLRSVTKVPDPGAIDRAWGYVTNSYVVPGHRGRGIGGRLLETVVSIGRALGHEFLIVWPSEEAISLYERAGFRHVDDVHAGPGDYPPLELDLR